MCSCLQKARQYSAAATRSQKPSWEIGGCVPGRRRSSVCNGLLARMLYARFSCTRASLYVGHMAEKTKTTVSPAVPRRAADRRSQPRYKFAADAEISEEKSGARIEARIDDISERGCHAETNSPFPLGTETKIRISKGGDSFAAQARVVSSSANGLGLAFSYIAPDQLPILETWLGSSRERDWLLLNRRRTQRVLVRVAVRVSARNPPASRFDEDTYTLAINGHGASILLSKSVVKGQRLELLNIATGDKAECVVAYLGQRQGDRTEAGIEFTLPNPNFWHVAFPPNDWTQPASGP